MARTEKLLPLVPGVLLVGVALWQVHLTRAEALCPWKGGGFGMFATTDAQANRYTRVYLRRGAAARPAPVPETLEALELRTRLHPSEERLHELASRTALHYEEGLGPLTGVRVEVWRRRFDPEHLEPRPLLLRQLEVSLDAG